MSLSRQPLEATERKPMTPARRARVLKAYGHCCAYPDCTETEGLEIDHEIALELGGKDDDGNLRPLCRAHHKVKTALDAKLIAKMRRRQAKDQGRFPKARHQIRNRGFAKGRNRVFEEDIR